ncbi:DUF4270 domain-containing protein [Aquimarina gracilis]|uniref:DUF4270 domain-containing protein n=1 Tax=Aquimarina gracilis TaxID=874422 RepID=A0ABU6A053_9FLAO|nr:DUF4270 domain-containing protein [Aquimarina gracilis]MEB3347518.1 DUF4270 domain-containing protein [Aquimarina gracilis]
MKLKNILIKTTVTVTVVFAFFSCEDDFNTVGSEVIGGVGFQDELYNAAPIAYSKRFERVQTSNVFREFNAGGQLTFHSNLLGVYDDPVYGQSLYSLLCQAQLPVNRFPVTFGENAVLDSVVFSMPYISRVTEVESVEVEVNGNTVTETASTYELDSVYQNKPFKISLFRSNYFLRDFDPTTTETQVYYSNDIESFGSAVEGEGPSGNGTPFYTNDNFVPSVKEIILTEKTKDVNGNDSITARSRVSPRLRVAFFDDPNIPNTNDPGNDVREYFSTLFLDKEGSAELSNQNNFSNYFRGVYFKAESVDNTGNLLYLNIREANITLHYTSTTTTTDDSDQTVEITNQGELVLSFANNILNGITEDFDPVIAEELRDENQDKVNGEDNLYLKGGVGSVAVIELFNRNIVNEEGEEENELEFLKRQNWLINDANLKFYINQDMVESGSSEPERIYVFNLETGEVLADYNLDVSLQLANSVDPVNSISNHLGRISRDADDAGEFYRIRITQHIANLLRENIDNIKLGVAVSQNVNSVTTAIGDTSVDNDETIPTSSIISHEGTVLYGTGANVPESKKLKLEIFYTESKNN